MMTEAANISKFVERVSDILGSRGVSVDQSARERGSVDRFELSPLLRERLPRTLADAVVWPKSVDEFVAVLDVAYAMAIPITPRGVGTGNYGQAVPLHRGVVIDTSKMTRILNVGNGTITAEAGARIFALDKAANRSGQELALIPSTVGSTIGGYVAGGSAGAGSIEHGWIWNGFVRELLVYTASGARRVSGEQTRPYVHSYGTTGVIGQVTVQLQPTIDRSAVFASFDDLTAACHCGTQLMNAVPRPRMLSLDSADVADVIHRTESRVGAGRANLRVVVDSNAVDETCQRIESAEGSVTGVKAGGIAGALGMAYNHVTERVLEHLPGYFHLQVSGEGLPSLESRATDFPNMMVHLDGTATDSGVGYIGFVYLPYDGPESIEAAIDEIQKYDVRVNDPHVWYLNRNVALYEETAAVTDPAGLFNPGKL